MASGCPTVAYAREHKDADLGGPTMHRMCIVAATDANTKTLHMHMYILTSIVVYVCELKANLIDCSRNIRLKCFAKN